jgi:hypothetical protein
MLEMLNEELRLSMVLTHCLEVADITDKHVIHMLKIDNVLARMWINLLINLLRVSSVFFWQTFADSSELAVDFARWASQNEVTNCVSGELNVTEATQNVNFLICYYNSRPCRVFYCVLCLSLFTADSSNTTTQVVTLKSFDVFDFKSLQIKIIKSQNCNCILHLETKHECFQEVSCFLNRTNVHRRFTSLKV